MATLLVGIFSAIGTIAGDLVKAFGGSTDSSDAQPQPGTGASQVASDASFKHAVGQKQVNSAANAATSVLTKTATDTVQQKATANAKQQQGVAAELAAVNNALQPCYEAEDWVFAINQLLTKTTPLDDGDRQVLNDWWDASEKHMSDLQKMQTSDLTRIEPSSRSAFDDVIAFLEDPRYKNIQEDLELQAKWTTPPIRLIQNTGSLLTLLQRAVSTGGSVIEVIAGALNSASQAVS